MAHDSNDVDSNVIYIDRERKAHGLYQIAGKLIADYAQDIEHTVDAQQHIAGDGNLQFSSDPVVRQSITGNWNVQISSNDPELERRLSFLEAYLKNPKCS